MTEEEMMHWTRRRIARIKWLEAKHRNDIRFQRFNCVIALIAMAIVWKWLANWLYGAFMVPAMIFVIYVLFSDEYYGN